MRVGVRGLLSVDNWREERG